MTLSRIPYRDTGFFSPLICDLVEQHPALNEMIGRFPSLASFGPQLKRKKEQYPAEHRAILCKKLEKQYIDLPFSEEVSANITLLKNANTFTVTTGHQLNLFTGPLYFVYKIISTINLCKQLKERYPENDFVPIYWMATEDHDFEEISYFNFKGKKSQVEQRKQGSCGAFTHR